MDKKTLIDQTLKTILSLRSNIADAGRKKIKESLSSPKISPWETIREIRNENSINFPRGQPLIDLLFSLDQSNSEVMIRLFEELKKKLEIIISTMDIDNLKQLLKLTFCLIKVPELADIPFSILKKVPDIPENYLNSLVENNIISDLPMNVRRQAWVFNEKFFSSSFSSIVSKYWDTRSKSQVQQLAQMIGSSDKLLTYFSDYCSKEAIADNSLTSFAVLLSQVILEIHNTAQLPISFQKIFDLVTIIQRVKRSQSIDEKSLLSIYEIIKTLILSQTFYLKKKLNISTHALQSTNKPSFQNPTTSNKSINKRRNLDLGSSASSLPPKRAKIDVDNISDQNLNPSQLIRAIKHLWNFLYKNDDQKIFSQPVTEDIAPGYSSVIKAPMDLSTIRKKIDSNPPSYLSFKDFYQDVELIFSNCAKFNGSDSYFGVYGSKLFKKFKNQIKQVVAQVQEGPLTSQTIVTNAPKPLSKNNLLKIWEEAATLDPQYIFAQKVTEEIAPGYNKSIKFPMDLSLIKRKILDPNVDYTMEDMNRDIGLMIRNCTQWNGPYSPITKYGKTFLSKWGHLYKSKLPSQATQGSDTSNILQAKPVAAQPTVSFQVDPTHDKDTLEFLKKIDSIQANEDFSKQTLDDVINICLDFLIFVDRDQIFYKKVTDEIAPEYSKIIKKPMSFSIMRAKIMHDKYHDFMEFSSDVELIISNCKTYNPPGSYPYLAANYLDEKWKKCLRKIKSNFSDLEEFEELKNMHFKGDAENSQSLTKSTSNHTETADLLSLESRKLHDRHKYSNQPIILPSLLTFSELQSLHGKAKARGMNPLVPLLAKSWRYLSDLDSNGFFASPVTIKGYLDVIKQPIDLGTIKLKLDRKIYKSLKAFDLDMELLVSNCFAFNAPETVVYVEAEKLKYAWYFLFEYIKTCLDEGSSLNLNVYPKLKPQGNQEIMNSRQSSTQLPTSSTSVTPLDSSNIRPKNVEAQEVVSSAAPMSSILDDKNGSESREHKILASSIKAAEFLNQPENSTKLLIPTVLATSRLSWSILLLHEKEFHVILWKRVANRMWELVDQFYKRTIKISNNATGSIEDPVNQEIIHSTIQGTTLPYNDHHLRFMSQLCQIYFSEPSKLMDLDPFIIRNCFPMMMHEYLRRSIDNINGHDSVETESFIKCIVEDNSEYINSVYRIDLFKECIECIAKQLFSIKLINP